MHRRSLVILALLAFPPSSAHAQSPAPGAVDARWSAWIGCWVPAARLGTEQPSRVCVVPAPDGRGVQQISFEGDRQLLSEPIVADGTPQRVAEDSCTGERTSRWASAGARLFSSSTLSCTNQPPLETSRISTLVTADQWLEVQVSKAGGREQVRARRFWRSTEEPPASVAEALRQVAPAHPVPAAVGVDDVIEASRNVPSKAVEAWLAESSTRIAVDRRALVRLSDAKVSTTVIDLMVALAYPHKFEVRRGASGGGGFVRGPFEDGFYPGEWAYLADVYGYGFGLGYPAWLWSNYYYYPGGIYIEPGGGGGAPAEETTHGQVVNGLGYTRVQPREPSRGTASRGGGASASTGSTNDSGSGSGGGSSGGSSSGSSGGVSTSGYSGGGGSTSTGLTAVPR